MTMKQFDLLLFVSKHPGIDHAALSVYNGATNAKLNRSLIESLADKHFLEIQKGEPGHRFCFITLKGEEALEEYAHQLDVEKRARRAQRWSQAAIIISALSLLVAILTLTFQVTT